MPYFIVQALLSFCPYLPILLSDLGEFRVRTAALHTVLFVTIRTGNDVAEMRRVTVRQSESKERLCQVCVLRHRTHRLSFC